MELPPLRAGATVHIAKRPYRVTAALGEGSFGTVWGAECTRQGGEVAIKEIICNTREALSNAMFEGELLCALAGESSDSRNEKNGALRRIPALIALQAEKTGNEAWKVRIVMTRISGEPLSDFLDLWRPVAPRSRGETYRQFAEACWLAKELISQLSVAFEHISACSYHRDVTPRNILVEDPEGFKGGPQFGLIDFGLAVDAARWRMGVSSVPSSSTQQSVGIPAWQYLNIAGDGRYWPVSSWLMFALGAKELIKSPGLCLEYKNHLDLHSMGITAFQVLAEMLPPPPENRAGNCNDPVLQKLWALRSTWEQYWEDITGFWQCIYDTFRNNGDFKQLKLAYVKAGVHIVIHKNLCALRVAVQEVRAACEKAPQSAGLGSASTVMSALLAMVSSGDKSDCAANWQRIRLLLEESEAGFASRGLIRRASKSPEATNSVTD